MTAILKLIYEANNSGIILWTEEGKLKSRIPKSFSNKGLLSQLSANKESILLILEYNEVFSSGIKLPYIYKVETIEEHVLSFAQERLWFIEQYEQGTNAYHIPLLVELEKDTDAGRLKDAIQQVIQRHEVLRTIFKQEDENYVQIVLQEELVIHEYSHENTNIEDQIVSDINTPFDLQKEFPIRVNFYQQEESVQLLITIHHIASDGWSEDILLKEIDAIYRNESLAELSIQYKDFSIWQREYLQGDLLKNQQDYWREKLDGYEHLGMPKDKIRPKQIDYSGADVLFSLNAELSNKLRSLSKTHGCTMYTTLLAGFYIVLSKYTGQNDIILGTPIANRHYATIQNLIGFFVNSLALREELNQENTIVELLSQVQNNLIEAQRSQDIPFEKIVETIGVAQDSSRHPIFQTMFGVQSFGGESACNLFKSLPLKDTYAIAKYDLSCFMDDSQEEIHGSFNFATSLYEEATIKRMITHYQLVLEQMVNEQDKKLKDYQLLTEEEYQQIVIDWNTTEAAYPKDKTIHELFEAQVLSRPNAIAIIFKEEALTYAELNAKANQLAKYIQSQTKVTPDTLITLCLDRSLETMIGILGILKAGAAYVPIDPACPTERTNYILEDTKASLILTQSHLVERFTETATVSVLAIDAISYEDLDASNLPIQNQPNDLAYVIYTSGTTGNPKGVLQTHGNVQRLFSTTDHQFEFSHKDTWTLYHSYIFDFSVWEMWGALFYGGKLIIPTNETVKDIPRFIDVCLKNKVSILNQTPTAFYTFADNLSHKDVSELSFKYIIFGGDALNVKLLNNWWDTKRKYKLDTTLINMYGITETTVHVTYKEVFEDEKAFSNIGKAIDDLSSYVLDSTNKPVPIGVIGELHIGGAGLARGYLNQLELTAEKFIPNPFASQAEIDKGYTRLYKTGDLVRLLPDGNMEYAGRNDFQVKIRGYRIELGEIENALSSIGGIKQTCVLAKEKNSNKYLVGYYVSDGTVTKKELLAHISIQLPDYMVPSILVEMEKFPLTINGKLDRKALPDAEFKSENSYEAPSTDLEIKICEIWEEVLNLEKIGISDDFFRIGGDSILSIQLSSRLRKQGFNCSVRAIFDHRTISKLAQFIAEDATAIVITAEQGNLEGEFDLLPVQHWFFDKKERNQLEKFNHWNQSFLIKVPELDISKLQKVIAKIVAQHDILRIEFGDRNQRYLSEIEIPELTCLSIGNEPEAEIATKLTTLQSTFDINKSPLWTIAYIDGYEDNSARLFFAFHHLIIDTVSWRILIEDFKTLYDGNALEKKSSSYRQWVQEISTYEEKHPTEKAYWEEILKKIAPAEVEEKQVHTSKAMLTNQQTSNLLQNANKAYHTEVNDLLLTALGLALQNWNASKSQFITLEGHGREDLNEIIDHSSTVGWFTTLYPVALKLEKDLSSSIKSIKESLRTIPNKGIGFGAMFPEELINLPRISFNYLGQFDSQDEYWQVLSENSGMAIHTDDADTTLININGMVVAGKLSFRVDTKLGFEQTEIFARNLEMHLSEVIKHCQTKIANNETKHTPSDFETVTISQSLLDELQKDRQIEAIYPANSLQQGFIYHALSQVEDDAYRVQFLFDYKQAFDPENYIKSWELAIEKYPILRAGFNWEEDIVQVIYRKATLNYELLDISHLTEEECANYLIELQERDRQIAFDLSVPCLLRLYIVKQSEDYYTILKSEHHSICDGWSGPVLLNTVHENYEQLQKNQEVAVRVDTSYLEAQVYVSNQKQKIADYWKTKVALVQQTNDLRPFISCKQDLDTIKSLKNAFEIKVNIGGDEYQVLKKLTKTAGLTLNTLVQFAWHKLIQVYTQDTQTIVGTTVSGRDIPINGIEESVGLYINTLPLIIDWDNEHTVLEQIQYFHDQITDINTHSFANLADLQKEGKRLFHSLFVFENYPMPENKEEGKDKLQATFRYAVEKVDYPIGITAYEQADQLVLKIESDRELLEEEKANFNLNKLKNLINALTSSLDKKHNELSILSEAEYTKMVIDWNQTEADYAKDQTIHELFQAQVDKAPDAIALVFENQQLTYKEVNSRANQLARYLQSTTEIKSDTLIALYMDRSLEMIIGILGILKSGGAYVPIDPAYPIERINYILEDTQTALVLSQSSLLTSLKQNTKAKLIALDKVDYQTLDVSNLTIENQSKDLAYVLYTSGTTGNPKGVMIEHRSVINLSCCLIDKYDITSQDAIIQFASIAFDMSVEEIFPYLFAGAKVVIRTVEMLDINHFCETVIAQDVTILNLPIPFGFLLEDLDLEKREKLLEHLRIVAFGGSQFSADLLELWSGNNIQILNAYGPTESTVNTTIGTISSDQVHIGTPIANTQVYILDAQRKPLPQGIIGEMYIGGAGISRGYLNKPDLTAEKFIENPFASQSAIENGHSKMYKTGDLVCWLDDGNLEYVDRNDFQVKIRGYRIELGEIEHALNTITSIKQSCVVVKEKNNTKYLTAYFVASEKLEEVQLVDLLKEQLPEYMLPGAFVQLENFSLTINGKIDRKELPDVEFENSASFIAPQTDLEIKICSIWQEVLGIDSVGVTDDFFRIGGNSILAIKLVGRMNKILSEIGDKLSIVDLFMHKSVNEILSNHVSESSAVSFMRKMHMSEQDKETLFFVHPAKGGCEVYTELAYELKNERNSYGVDNFNIIQEKTISNLNLLAEKYVDALLTIDVAHPINLCGWSLGGHIALEMGYILEQRGFRNINIYILDTLIWDTHLLQLLDTYSEVESTEIENAKLISDGFDEAYARNVVRAAKAEDKIGKQSVSGILKSSRVILFKALQHDTRIDFEGSDVIQTYIQKLEDNNVGQFVENLEVINLDCHHGNIIEKVLENSEYSNQLVSTQEVRILVK
ncbi:amino acid adenylation domain-containing protein [Kordia sp. YSTF-M3]|uniref:Amino acid adenylation domain-containing protein n=1 Tax=Kordia aestuariivivens TaxID=2759037 RepID=A0ABR7QDA4_9FLAO|nr:non-ribosomal peptide synthetase [Kordia aestuariivivens]MBC8756557.1 amino acid adenylation domain-containing protein [Kordia aestuariivivens]